jgi:hypothetical protein
MTTAKARWDTVSEDEWEAARRHMPRGFWTETLSEMPIDTPIRLNLPKPYVLGTLHSLISAKAKNLGLHVLIQGEGAKRSDTVESVLIRISKNGARP